MHIKCHQISFTQCRLESQHKNTDVHDNGNGDNQKDSDNAL